VEWCDRDLGGPSARAAFGGSLMPALVATQVVLAAPLLLPVLTF